jgi:nucleoside 2-deoxyribosyltransferase
MLQPSIPSPIRIYCAGPLFNQAERDEMTAIADVLCEAGFTVYLPHRDGMEFRLILEELVDRGWPAPLAAQFLHAAIFALDVYQLAQECQAVAWNLNGRVPDEGAVSEAAIAWTLGKPIVAYMDDVRSLISGRVNPMLVGLVEFETKETIGELPSALKAAIEAEDYQPLPLSHLPPRLTKAVSDGSRLWRAMQQAQAQFDNELIAEVVAELFAPTSSVG